MIVLKGIGSVGCLGLETTVIWRIDLDRGCFLDFVCMRWGSFFGFLIGGWVEYYIGGLKEKREGFV